MSISAQFADPPGISVQLASTAHDTAHDTASAHAKADEARDAKGEWSKTGDGPSPRPAGVRTWMSTPALKLRAYLAKNIGAQDRADITEALERKTRKSTPKTAAEKFPLKADASMHYVPDGGMYHRVEARTPDGKKIGSLEWSKANGDIHMVEVSPAYRHLGVASAMLGHAQGLKGVGKPKHSANRTGAGIGWSDAVGGAGSARFREQVVLAGDDEEAWDEVVAALDLAGPETVSALLATPLDGGPAAVTARHLDDTARHLAHASKRLDAAQDATGDDRAGHLEHCARHLDDALTSAHDLAANLRASYAAEGGELDTLTGTIGLAKAVSEDAKTATTAHLTQTICNHLGHTIRHVAAMAGDTDPQVQAFNGEHARTHLDGGREHVAKLTRHLTDNYPREAAHLEDGDAAELAVSPHGLGSWPPDWLPPGIAVQLAEPESISGQLDLSAASRQKAHDTASATARAHERRDARGQWTHGTGDDIGRGDEGQRGGRKPATGKDVIREWRKSKDDLVRKHLNQASAHLDAGDYAAAGDELKHAGTMAMLHGDTETGDRLDKMGRSLSEESRANATVADFAAKGAQAVTGLLGAGHNGWNGKVDLFNAEDQPAIAAALNWDGTMQFQREMAQKMRDDKGGPVDDPQPYVTALHELIHGALPAAKEPAEWKALAPADRDALAAFAGMDKANVSAGEYPTLHSLDDAARHAPQVTQDTIDSLAARGLLEKAGFASSRMDLHTLKWVEYHQWKMTGKARDITPAPQQTHAMHSGAYQNPAGAAVEEGFTELGTVHHAPEFFARMGVGDRPTKYTAFEGGHPKVNPVYASTKAAVFSKLADTERALSADPRGPQQQAAQAARRAAQALNDDDLPGAEDDLAELRHLGDPDVTQAAKSIQAGLDKMQAAGFAARATMSEYAKRLRDPDRIAKGNAWGHYAWQTAAAQSWVRDAAKAEGKGPKSPRVRDLADEINREGVGGKVPAMVRQVIRAAGGDPDDPGWARPSLALGNLIKEQWPQGPAEAQSSPWASALAAARKFVPLMT